MKLKDAVINSVVEVVFNSRGKRDKREGALKRLEVTRKEFIKNNGQEYLVTNTNKGRFSISSNTRVERFDADESVRSCTGRSNSIWDY